MADIAPRGNNTARFIDLKQTTRKSKTGVLQPALQLTVELDKKNKSGIPFQVDRFYNLGTRAQGVTQFVKDCLAWSGRRLTPEELDAFDPSQLVGKPVTVVISHRKEGKTYQPVIEEFLPAGPTENQTTKI